MLSTPPFVVVAVLLLAKEIICCVVNPREFLTTVGEVVSLECNARPNNEQRGSVSNMKLENEDKSENLIFQAPVYNKMGEISTEQFVANGYFLSKLDDNLVKAKFQINETQLEHGGRYVCSCTAATISTGSANLVVLADKLSFALSGGGDLQKTPGALIDLNCSLSFSGSISSASVDLTINGANGTQLAANGNLSLTGSEGSLYVNYSFIAHGNKEQNFTCQMKVWNQSSSEKRLLRSMIAHYSLNSGLPDIQSRNTGDCSGDQCVHSTVQFVVNYYDSRSDAHVTQTTVSNASVGRAVGVGSLELVLIVSVVFVRFVGIMN